MPSPRRKKGANPSSPFNFFEVRRVDKMAGHIPSWLIAPLETTMRHAQATYRAVTRDIEILVAPQFMAERSAPAQSYFFWSYTITIVNRGTQTVQLLTRHWIITDAFGREQEVIGDGVVGEQPVLKPGERFEYTSGVPLSTPSGFMSGTYGMTSANGAKFRVDIPAFSLDSPSDAPPFLN